MNQQGVIVPVAWLEALLVHAEKCNNNDDIKVSMLLGFVSSAKQLLKAKRIEY